MKKEIKTKKNNKDLDLKIDKLIKTVDSLAVSTAKGFEEVNVKIEEVNRSIARVENNLIFHIGSVNRRMDDFTLNRVKYEDHDLLKARVDVLETHLK